MPTTCPCLHCGLLMSVSNDMLGQTVQCPNCDHVFTARLDSSSSGTDIAAGPPIAADRIRDSSPLQRGGPKMVGAGEENEAPQIVTKKLPGYGTTMAVVLLLGLSVLLLGVSIWISGVELDYVQKLERSRLSVTAAAATQFDIQRAVLGVFQLLTALATVIVYCMWLYQTRKNLAYLHVRDLTCTPDWAVAWYFVPIFNYFKPYKIMQETWKASSPSGVIHDPDAWQGKSSSSLVVVWWVFWISGNFLAVPAFGRVMHPNKSLLTWQEGLGLTITSEVLLILAGLSLMGVIAQLRDRQAKKWKRLREEI